ncbi:MAG: DNA-3-methyladenine glycosylase 2 family protein [Acidimicrobiia bacterium]
MTTVRREMRDALECLAAVDAEMRRMIETSAPCDLGRGRRRTDHFAGLARAIIFQQLAGNAATAIATRFGALFDDGPTPEGVAALPVEALRGVGLSGSKAATIADLAARVLDGSVELGRVARLPDDEVVRELTLVRGIGPWTAHMFLMFQLGRLDVWPVGDYGVRKGYALLYRHDELPAPRELDGLGARFRPFRSVAAWYCWRAVETAVPG